MSASTFEKRLTKEIRDITKNKKADWLEWGSSEQVIDKNLREGETKLYLPMFGVWVSYK